MIDEKLLIKLVSIQSSYREDTDINAFIEAYINNNLSKVTVTKDEFGNVYATKGEGKKGYKCIVSHTDTVHSIRQNRKVYIHGRNLFAMASTESKFGSSISQAGIGGDDKCGVYTCLKALEDLNDIKAVFFRFEESGCVGSRASEMKFFDDCNFVVQCDRRGNSDFITFTNGIQVASEEFKSAMKPIYEKYGYSSCLGIATDVGALKSRGLKISACNLSCGYYDPHTSAETINMDDLDNCYQMVVDMFNAHGETKFEHEYVKKEIALWSSREERKGKFRTSLSRNFFADRTIGTSHVIEKIIIQDDRLSKFTEVGNTGIFKLLTDEFVEVESDGCPICGSKEDVFFSSNDRSFYCTDIQHNGFLYDKELFRNCAIEDNGILFVYDRINDCWYEKSTCNWNEKSLNYELNYVPK